MNRLKELREENKILQNEVAKFLGIPQSNYSRYELNPYSMPVKRYILLADYYNTSIDYLLGLTNIKERYPSIKKDEWIVYFFSWSIPFFKVYFFLVEISWKLISKSSQ